VSAVFKKFTRKGEMHESGVHKFFDEIYGQVPSKRSPQNAKRLLELRTFVQHAKSESASTIDNSVITERSLRAYLSRNDAAQLTYFADLIRARLANKEEKNCVEDIHKENNQSLSNMKRKNQSDEGFECVTCGERFESWDVCQSHLIRSDHMGARKSMRGLRKRCKKQFCTQIEPNRNVFQVHNGKKRQPESKLSLDTRMEKKAPKEPIAELGFICCECETHFKQWPQCLSHLKECNHMGAQQKIKGLKRKCRKKYDSFSLEENGVKPKGYRCLICAESFMRWKDCQAHQTQSGHSGSIEKCQIFYEEWKDESAI